MIKLISPRYIGATPAKGREFCQYKIIKRQGRWQITIEFFDGHSQQTFYCQEHGQLVFLVNEVKFEYNRKPGGIFHLNEFGQIIVPASGGAGLMYYFAGEFNEVLEFSDFNNKLLSSQALKEDGQLLKPGEVWTALPVGFRYILMPNGKDVYYDTVPDEYGLTQTIHLRSVAESEPFATLQMLTQRIGMAGGKFYVNDCAEVFFPDKNNNQFLYAGSLTNLPWFPKRKWEIIK